MLNDYSPNSHRASSNLMGDETASAAIGRAHPPIKL